MRFTCKQCGFDRQISPDKLDAFNAKQAMGGYTLCPKCNAVLQTEPTATVDRSKSSKPPLPVSKKTTKREPIILEVLEIRSYKSLAVLKSILRVGAALALILAVWIAVLGLTSRAGETAPAVFIGALVSAVFLFAQGQLIQLGIDMQENTQTTAHYSKRLFEITERNHNS